LHMDPGGKIYTIDEFRCWKVENLDDEGSDENKNEKEGYRVVSPQKVSRFAPLYRIHANPRETKSGRGSRVCHAPPQKIIFQKDAIFT
ncbi:hypothetical protein BROOK1789C_1237, partial [Bathymodiolus brooksi thiotrophic gill symbiont]